MQTMTSRFGFIVTIQVILLTCFLNGSVFGFGPPDYKPDGPHPRLLIDSDIINKIKDMEASGTNIFYNNMKSRATQYGLNGNLTGDWYTPNVWKYPEVLALLWLVTGDTKWRDAAITNLKNGMEFFDNKPSNDGFRKAASNYWRWQSHNFIYAYDWLYNDLTPQQRSDWANMLCDFATYQKDYGYHRDIAVNNYFGAQFRGIINIGVTTYGETITRSGVNQPLTLLDHARTTMKGYIHDAMNGFSSGGVYPEGPEYAPHTLSYIFTGMHGALTGTGQDMFSEFSDWMNDYIYFTIHQSAPDNFHSYPMGDYIVSSDPDATHPSMTAAAANLIVQDALSHTTQGKYLQHWFHAGGFEVNNATWWSGSGIEPFPIIFFDKNDTGINYFQANLTPVFYENNNVGLVLSRSSWTTDATWWGFINGWRGIDHQQGESGNFLIKRKGEYVVGSENGWANVYNYTAAHNSMLLENEAPTRGGLSREPFLWEVGAQLNVVADAHLQDLDDLTFLATSDFTYIRGEDTNHYNSAYYNMSKLDHHFRSFVDLKDGTFIVFDTVKNNANNLFKKWVLHYPIYATPTLSGNTVTYQTSKNQFKLTAVLPQNAQLSQVRESTINSRYLNYWRFISEGDRAGLTETFLNVIEVGDPGNAHKTITLLQTDSGNMKGLLIEGSTDKVVLFGADYDGSSTSGTIRFSYPATVSDPELYLFGITPDASYELTTTSSGTTTTITIDVDTSGETSSNIIAATSQGVLTTSSSVALPGADPDPTPDPDPDPAPDPDPDPAPDPDPDPTPSASPVIESIQMKKN